MTSRQPEALKFHNAPMVGCGVDGLCHILGDSELPPQRFSLMHLVKSGFWERTYVKNKETKIRKKWFLPYKNLLTSGEADIHIGKKSVGEDVEGQGRKNLTSAELQRLCCCL